MLCCIQQNASVEPRPTTVDSALPHGDVDLMLPVLRCCTAGCGRRSDLLLNREPVCPSVSKYIRGLVEITTNLRSFFVAGLIGDAPPRRTEAQGGDMKEGLVGEIVTWSVWQGYT